MHRKKTWSCKKLWTEHLMKLRNLRLKKTKRTNNQQEVVLKVTKV
jgi:hypothetical protein